MENSNLKLLLAACLLLPSVAAAQQTTSVTGRVLRVGDADTSIVANQLVTIHRVGLDGGEAVDSVATNRRGTYRFPAIEMDSLALYVVSADYAGIAYFTSPVPPSGDSAGLVAPLMVYDTSSVGPAISTFQRHLIISPTDEGNGVGVLELVIVDNPTRVTRVSPDSASPVWSGRIPAEAVQFQVSDGGEVSPRSIVRAGNLVGVTSPIPPGRKQIVYSYVLPNTAETVRVDVDQPVEQMNVLIDVRSGGTLTGGLEDTGPETIGNQTYRHYVGREVAAGLVLSLRFPGAPLDPADLVPWFAAVVGLIMVFALWSRMRSTPAPARPAAPVLDADVLARRIAALDRQFESIEAPTEAQRNSYGTQRGELKALLAAALANDTERA